MRNNDKHSSGFTFHLALCALCLPHSKALGQGACRRLRLTAPKAHAVQCCSALLLDRNRNIPQGPRHENFSA